jgi:hypothetical protein
MPRMAPMPDTCRTAADVRAAARVVFERRRAAYENLAAAPAEPELLAERSAVNPPPPRPICCEVSRQLGIQATWLQKGTESSRHANDGISATRNGTDPMAHIRHGRII